ncbi:MAG: hypothetical protein EOO90_12695 [Pedobacter sp.]|nr:MAG: hypothetical protein EOO90_12695 [Pedobacter sp.]
MKNSPTLFLILFLTIASVQVCGAQNLKGKEMDSLYFVHRFRIDLRQEIEKKLLQQYRKSNQQEVLSFVEILRFSHSMSSNFSLVEKFSNEIKAKYKAFPNIQARAYQIVGYHYFIGIKNYEKAFDAYIQLEKLLEAHGHTIISDYSAYCSEIAAAYYKFKNFKKAIEISKKGIGYSNDKWDFYNTIGLCYGELLQVDSSIFYFNKAVDEAVKLKKADIYRTISLGNKGYSYYRQNKIDLAKPLLMTDLEGALRVDDKGLAAGAAITLADVYLSERKLELADSLLEMSRKFIAKSNQLDRLEQLFPIVSKYHQLKGNSKLALAYRDSTIKAIKRNDSVFNGLLVMRVQQRTDLAKLTEEKTKLENYREISNLRLWAICIIFILIILGFFIVRRYNSRLERNKKHIEELNRVLHLRQRLSADMHDDVGSTLSSISLYTHSLLMQPQTDTQSAILKKIKQSAQNVQESMSDIIWSVNPDMDSMGQMVARMRIFGANMTEHSGITFTFNMEDAVADLKIEMSARRNIYMIYKEAINNAVKYSKGKHINIALVTNNHHLEMKIADDGIGFDKSTSTSGNGLINMQRRAEEIDAKLFMESSPENGMVLKLILSFKDD